MACIVRRAVDRLSADMYLDILTTIPRLSTMKDDTLRIGQAAEILDVGVDTIRRWEAEGRIETRRTAGGQRRVPLAEVRRLLASRRAEGRATRPVVAQSSRNRFAGIVTRIERDGVAAVIEVQCGPHRLVSLMTAEAADELGLAVGDEAACAVKATNVVVEVPG
jgi:molybdopterin-binding protein